ncbi:Uncharacterised protein [Vibrio cholerae]|nr:Uncharacterised protein [Vibrio cholerae]
MIDIQKTRTETGHIHLNRTLACTGLTGQATIHRFVHFMRKVVLFIFAKSMTNPI